MDSKEEIENKNIQQAYFQSVDEKDKLKDQLTLAQSQLTSAQTMIGEQKQAIYHWEETIIQMQVEFKQREQQIASDAWDACENWIMNHGYPNKSQYLASLTGAKKEGGV